MAPRPVRKLSDKAQYTLMHICGWLVYAVYLIILNHTTEQPLQTGRFLGIRSFNEITTYDFAARQNEQIKSEIQTKSKEYILEVNAEEFIQYLVDKYSLQPLTVDFSDETTDAPIISKETIEDPQ